MTVRTRKASSMASVGVALGPCIATPLAALSAPQAAPTQVGAFRGRYCRSMGPRGWAVIALLSGDGKAAASYAIFGAGTLNPIRGYENPNHKPAAASGYF